ncbi:MAG TPA: ABC transporter ATP-binding protein [Ktedonobacterales bacterium]|nr:ABC transporter ATP-binding protein [Ktedonobacterales bacterium]
MTEAAIRTTTLTRDFGAVRAVDALTLEVPPGIIFGFLGANGAGKTTTINLLLGLLEPTTGQAQVLGFDTLTQGSAIRQRTGALLEFSGLYERLSAEDNLDFYGRVWHLSTAERQARIKELLTHVGLYDRRNERVGTWSRGMKQKLAITRVLLHRPTLIFLDEPTAGLDPVAAAALRDDLEGLVANEGVTVFLNTHNLPEAERLCQQVGVIRSGKLLTVGSPDLLRRQTGSPQAEVSGDGFTPEVLARLRARRDIASARVENKHLILELTDQQVKMAPIVTALVEAGVQIEEVRRGQASLEDVFLTLMEEDRAKVAIS